MAETIWASTGVSNYYAGFSIDVVGNTPDSDTAVVTIQPYLKNVVGVEQRYQHHWYVRVFKDNELIHAPLLTLPDITSACIPLEKNKEYAWGPSYVFYIPKIEATTVSFSLELECLGTTPRKLPRVSKSITFNKYYIDPGTPAGLKTTFDPDTRRLTYHWDPATCQYITLYRVMYDENKNKLPNEGFYKATGRTGQDLYNSDSGVIYDILPDDVVKVEWELRNVSLSGDFEATKSVTTMEAAYTKVMLKPGNARVKSIPWVKVDGVWKKCTKTYIKVGSSWKRTIS